MHRLIPIMVALLAATGVHAQQAEVSVVNPGFEGDEDGDGIADGWTAAYGAPEESLDVTFSLEDGREAGTCQRVECTRWEDGHAMVCQVGTVAVEQGQWYRITLWARAEGRPQVGVAIHDTDGWRHCGLWRHFRPTSRWRRFSWRFQGDHDCHETSRLQIWFSSTGTLWVDDLVLEQIQPPASANIIPDIGSTNLVPNSSFECGPDRWISAGHWRLFGEVVAEDAVHGSHCMRVEWSRETAPVFSFDYYEMRRDPYTRPAVTSEGWMRVEEGADYVFSMYLRADRPVESARIHAFGPTRGFGARVTGTGPDWRRVELPFTATEKLCCVQVDVDCDEAGLDELTYWVDVVQLERGETATDYQPRRPVEIGVRPTNGHGIFVGEQPELRLVAYNDGADAVELALSVTVTDGFDRTELERQDTITIPAGERVTQVSSGIVDLPFSRVTCSAEGIDDRSVRIASLPELALEDSPFGINHAYAWDPYLELAQKLGVKWVRDWSLKWDHVEPEPGRFEFEMADYQIGRPQNLGMNLLCMFPFPSAGWSSTAPPLEEIPEQLRTRAPYRIRTAYAPRDPAELDQYVYECVQRYRDRIDVWEVFNESIFTSYSLPQRAGYEATDYVPLLQAVYRGCKRADADCTVIGGYSVPPERFDELHGPFMEAGGLDFCDAYSLHIYPGGEPEFIAAQLDRIRDAMRQHGGVKPMWMTEYAYYGDDDPDPIPRRWPALVESELIQARWNTRMCVTQLAHGVEKVFYHIWHTRANRDSGARIFFEYGGAPRKIAASQAAMARMLGPGPQFLREVDIGENASCYIFGNRPGPDGEGPALVAVAWHHWEQMDWGDLSARRRVHDMFGRAIVGDSLNDTPGPIYVLERDVSADDFAAAIREDIGQ
ncbi:MAG: hypothetical protein U9R79_11695 [Armatimonadota bacterium]|nr:hypothetical protein [Armatimonadota bacterium]